MELRDYQSASIDAVRAAMGQHRRVLLVAPTGSGKTAQFSYIAAGVNARNRRVLILAHRKELIRQIGEALSAWDVPFSVVGQSARSANVTVGNVFTVVRRLDKIEAPDLIVVDEAHHATSSSTWGKILAQFPAARVLGVTATPCRMDGKGLGNNFDDMVTGPTVAELTELGWLSPTEVYAPSRPDLSKVHKRMGDYVQSELDAEMNKPTITGNAVQHYLRICPGATAIAFCVSIAHAKAVAAEFQSFGVAAESVDGKMHDAARDSVLNGLRSGRVKIVTSCDLISEGYDAPAVDCAILLRPTKSLGLFLQQCGRAIRIAPGKTKTIILDHASNTLTHGFIDEPREWTLDGGAPKKKKGSAPIRTCPQCFAAHHPSKECPMCGYLYEIRSREDTIDFVNADLIKVIDPKSLSKSEVLGNPSRQKEMEHLTRVARERGYRNPEGWAYVVTRAREAKRRTKAAQKQAKQGAVLNV